MLAQYIYKLFSVLHFPSKEQSVFLKLHDYVLWLLELISFLLCDLVNLPRFVCNSRLPGHYSFCIFFEVCLKKKSVDLAAGGTSFGTLEMTARL